MPVIIDGTNGITQAGEFNSDSSFGFKNRIINGAMVIDQRNAGASVTPADNTYTLDRWQASQTVSSKFSVQQSSTVPTGFINSMLITSLSSYSVGSGEVFAMAQQIEGYNVADLNWGTANAKTVTLSFWVRSSLTGTFGGALANSNVTRSYPFTYTISVANTFEYKSVTIAGDTSGTWQTTTSTGIRVWIGLGVGSTYSGTAGAWAGSDFRSVTGATSVVATNGATFFITGVQLEVGTAATNFDVRSIGTELALAQRYYQQIGGNSFVGNPLYPIIGNGFAFSTNQADIYVPLRVTMRSTPTITSSGTAIQVIATAYTVTSLGDVGSTFNTVFLRISTAGTFTAGDGALWSGNNSATSYGAFSSEL